MNKFFKAVRYFIRSNWNEKREVFLIIMMSAKIALMVNFIPLRHYYSKYFTTTQQMHQDLQLYKRKICLVKKILNHLPWKVSCLTESLIVKRYIYKQFGVDLIISVGISKSSELKAHAWYGKTVTNEFVNIVIP
ncbi:MAG: lasso peptide biosynthesis B2 protein [Bacteroidales bacterium]|nr:lasso peptide biosynthesis B2 protein [Bacteroidales bacterium]